MASLAAVLEEKAPNLLKLTTFSVAGRMEDTVCLEAMDQVAFELSSFLPIDHDITTNVACAFFIVTLGA